MVGGLVIAGGTTGRSSRLAYVMAATGQVLQLLLLIGVRGRPVERREAISGSEWSAGVRFVARNPLILGTISLDLFAVLLGGATALLPMYAVKVLGVGAVGFC